MGEGRLSVSGASWSGSLGLYEFYGRLRHGGCCGDIFPPIGKREGRRTTGAELGGALSEAMI